MIKPLTESVDTTDIEPLAEFLAKMKPMTAPAGKINSGGKESAKNDSIQRRFETFHEKNPEVMELLVERTRSLKMQGRTRVSMSELWEWLRYESNLKSKFLDSSSKFAISNDYRSRYARALIARYPDISDLFEVRPLTAK